MNADKNIYIYVSVSVSFLNGSCVVNAVKFIVFLCFLYFFVFFFIYIIQVRTICTLIFCNLSQFCFMHCILHLFFILCCVTEESHKISSKSFVVFLFIKFYESQMRQYCDEKKMQYGEI